MLTSSPRVRQGNVWQDQLVQLGPQPLGRLQSDGNIVRAVVLPPHRAPLAQWYFILRTRRVPTCGRHMFQYATSFNSDLSRWDVSKAIGGGMSGWDEELGWDEEFGNLSRWDVSKDEEFG